MKFTEFEFDEKILKALKILGLTEPTEVQKQVIPLIFEKENIVVRSQTGSGKTFAFALPILQNTSVGIIFPETLIVCPTRELTLQVCDEIKKISTYMEGVKVMPVYGGSNIERQVQALKRKPQIIVGTPGRILDHISRKTLKLHYLKNVVLDEADEMLNMGFKEDIEKILKNTPEDKNIFLFSATYPEKIKQIVNEYLPKHTKVEIGSENKSLKNIFQQYVLLDKKMKTSALLELIKQNKNKRILIFCNTKTMTEKLANMLSKAGFNADSLHGDLKQSQRKIVTNNFKLKKIDVLVASDVAARGLDIEDIDYVINFDLPSNLEYFLHRMGRTARAGKNGNAITIITSKMQLKLLKEFELETKSSISQLQLSNFDYVENQFEVKSVKKDFSNKRNVDANRKASANKNAGVSKRTNKDKKEVANKKNIKSDENFFKNKKFKKFDLEKGNKSKNKSTKDKSTKAKFGKTKSAKGNNIKDNRAKNQNFSRKSKFKTSNFKNKERK